MSKVDNKKTRWWILTVPAEHDGVARSVDDVARIIAPYAWAGQLERGHESTEEHPDGYPHYQVLMHCPSSPVSFSTVKNHFTKNGAPDIHFEQLRGTPQQAWVYVHKDDTREQSIPDEHGLTALDVVDKRGHRSDLDTIADEIRSGRTVDDILLDSDLGPKIAHAMPWAQALEAAVRRDRLKSITSGDRPLHVWYVWGPSGIGKSWWAHHLPYDTYVLPRPSSGRVRWDGYTDQSTVIIDEFRAGINATDLNAYLDPYALTLPARYHDGHAAYVRVVILSNWSPDDFYRSDATQHAAWMRRLNDVYHVETREDLQAIAMPSADDYTLAE